MAKTLTVDFTEPDSDNDGLPLEQDRWEDETLEDVEPVLEHVEPVKFDNEIISEMLQDAYKLALEFYGNETKARKLLELAVYVPIFGSFGYKKMWWNLFQDPETKSLYKAIYENHGFVNLAHVVPPVSLEGIKKQLDKVIPILELALLEKKSGNWLWMHIKLSSIED